MKCPCWASWAYLGNGVLDNLLVGHIALVSDEELVDALSGVSVDLLQPLLHVVEGVHVGNIVDDADAVSTSVVGRGDCAETLLASCVPLVVVSISHTYGVLVRVSYDLKLDCLSIEFDGSDFLRPD